MDERWCYELLRRTRWPAGVACVRCGARTVVIHTRSRRTPRLKYLCRACHRTFTDLTGTVFARSNLPLATWFRAVGLLRQGLAVGESARALALKWETAGRLTRRLLVAAGQPGLVRDLEAALASPSPAATSKERT